MWRRIIERCGIGAKQHAKEDAAHKREAAPVAGEHSQLAEAKFRQIETKARDVKTEPRLVKSASNSAGEKAHSEELVGGANFFMGGGLTFSHGEIVPHGNFVPDKPMVPTLKAQSQLAKSPPPPKEKDIGFVYLATNKAMSGLVKIGMTNGDVNERMRGLSNNTGVPCPFQCAYYCEVRSPKEVESILHEKFDFCRWSGNREFFKVDWRAVKVALEEIAKLYPKEKDNI